MKNKTPQQLGTEFQNDVQAELKKIMDKEPAYMHRLYDTRSAGNCLPKQPGDFIFIYRGVPILVEAKASGKYDSLSQGRSALTKTLSANQVASARLWDRAKGVSIILFKSLNSGKFEGAWGTDVADAYLTAKGSLAPDKLWQDDDLFSLIRVTLNTARFIFKVGRN